MCSATAMAIASMTIGVMTFVVVIGLAVWLAVGATGKARGLAIGGLLCSLLTLVVGFVFGMTGLYRVMGFVGAQVVSALLHLLSLGLLTAAVVASRRQAEELAQRAWHPGQGGWQPGQSVIPSATGPGYQQPGYAMPQPTQATGSSAPGSPFGSGPTAGGPVSGSTTDDSRPS